MTVLLWTPLMRQLVTLREITGRAQQPNVFDVIIAAFTQGYPMILVIAIAYIYIAVETLTVLQGIKRIDLALGVRAACIQLAITAHPAMRSSFISISLAPSTLNFSRFFWVILNPLVNAGIYALTISFVVVAGGLTRMIGISAVPFPPILACLFWVAPICPASIFAGTLLVIVTPLFNMLLLARLTPTAKTCLVPAISVPKLIGERINISTLRTALLRKQGQLNVAVIWGRIIHSNLQDRLLIPPVFAARGGFAFQQLYHNSTVNHSMAVR